MLALRRPGMLLARQRVSASARLPATALRRRAGGAFAGGIAVGACAACVALCQNHSGAGSPFVYPELTEATERRIISQQRLVDYMRSTQQIVGALQMQLKTGSLGASPEEATKVYWARMRELQEEVALETQKILYGVEEKGARAAYEAEFGCVRWTASALDILVGLSPVRPQLLCASLCMCSRPRLIRRRCRLCATQLVEIGAGAGHWQRELSARGANVLAYESGEDIPLPQRVMVGDVKQGDHNMAARCPERTLFLCYPPQSEMAYQAVRLVSQRASMCVLRNPSRAHASPVHALDSPCGVHARCSTTEIVSSTLARVVAVSMRRLASFPCSR